MPIKFLNLEHHANFSDKALTMMKKVELWRYLQQIVLVLILITILDLMIYLMLIQCWSSS